MLRKRLISVVSALIVLGVAACGGGGSTGPTITYPPAGTGQTGTLDITPVGGTSASVTVSGTGTFAVSGSLTSPTSVALDATAKRSAQSGTGSVPVLYLTITASNAAATLSSVSAATVNTGSPPSGSGSYYLAYWNGTEWVTLKATAGSVSGDVISVTGAALPVAQQSLAEGSSDYFVVYNGVVVPPTPTPSPSPTPSPTPQATATPNAISNGNFESGALSPWVACSYAHTGYTAAVNPSPSPAGISTQAPAATAVVSSTVLTQASPNPWVQVTAPPANYNPTQLNTATGNLGSYAALTGSLAAQINGATGICQTFTVPATGLLSFWVYEGGTAYSFYNGDQEAQLFTGGLTGDTPTSATPAYTFFVELNCYYDQINLPPEPAYPTSGCQPGSGTTPSYPAYAGTSAYLDWQGGFWTERGPYNLNNLNGTNYAGDSVTLFIGTWSSANKLSYPSSYANYMFVDNVGVVP